MATVDFKRLLSERIGLDAGSIGQAAVARAVETRQAACGLVDPSAYWELVCRSPDEQHELIELVVVPETWFFRDRGAFAALADLVGQRSRSDHADAVVRILSLPSASGEEPYSIAMTLLDAGVPPARFRIDAVDISRTALARAARATYQRNSFRDGDLTALSRHFTTVADGYRLSDQVRALVYFQQGNLCSGEVLQGLGIYDVVFCRNLLIYLNQESLDRAATVLRGLMTGDGVLFVAPSEAGALLARGFRVVGAPAILAPRRTAEADTLLAPPARRRASKTLAPAVRTAAAIGHKPTAAEPGEVPSTSDLSVAVQLADEGRFDEAARACEVHLREHGPSARAFHLLGLVKDATGRRADALRLYRKALYLDPDFLEALSHLALLLEEQGHSARAEQLRKRARSLSQAEGV